MFKWLFDASLSDVSRGYNSYLDFTSWTLADASILHLLSIFLGGLMRGVKDYLLLIT